jgi:hypothetical protein
VKRAGGRGRMLIGDHGSLASEIRVAHVVSAIHLFGGELENHEYWVRVSLERTACAALNATVISMDVPSS